MVRQPVRIALLLGAITAVAAPAARAQDKAPATTNPCTRTITVTECVPETYTVKRMAHKYECRTEEYDTFRCETVPVVKERTVCCTKRVPVEREEVRKVCRTVTDYEERVVTRNTYKTVQETVMQKKCVSRGHWECREEAAPSCGLFSGCGLFGNHGCGNSCNTGCGNSCGSSCNTGCGHRSGCGLFGGHGCGNSCGHNACSSPCGDACAQPCRTVTRKVWVSCPQYVDCPVTVCKKVCCPEQVKCKVAVCRQVWDEVKVKVCTYQCVTENRVEKYTCCETRKVPCKATRTVRVCVPYEETVTCTRMVARQVTREVPVSNVCCDPCANQHHGLFSCLFGGCNRGCNTGCHSGCSTSCSSSCSTGCNTGCSSGCNLFGGCGARHNSGCCR